MPAKRSEREDLEAELVRIDRTLTQDRKHLARVMSDIDELVAYRLRIKSKLSSLKGKRK
jgi:hypothetical protein